jgi:hypothetical protein
MRAPKGRGPRGRGTPGGDRDELIARRLIDEWLQADPASRGLAFTEGTHHLLASYTRAGRDGPALSAYDYVHLAEKIGLIRGWGPDGEPVINRSALHRRF